MSLNISMKFYKQGAEPELSPPTVVKGWQFRFRALYSGVVFMHNHKTFSEA